jgi:hypothetical protein
MPSPRDYLARPDAEEVGLIGSDIHGSAMLHS